MQTRIIEIERDLSGHSFQSTSLHSERYLHRSASYCGIVSQSPLMQKVFSLIKKVASTPSTVLILGESGTGKELIARALHKTSGRSGKLVPVNCGAIPEEILESELFGHEKGSFTGAVTSKIGRFQLADGGTIFLDEIGEMSPKLQVKLLRVLQEKKVEPVGSTRSIDVDVRIIAATNKDLKEEVKQGRFREDLFYRLQVVPIELPPLRERSGDALLLANHFIEKICESLGRPTLGMTEEVKRSLLSYAWPGNVRELENLTERLCILAENPFLSLADIPEYMRDSALIETLPGEVPTPPALEELPPEGINFNKIVDDFETKLITLALERTGGNKKAAARLLQLNRTTLVEKIRKKGLSKKLDCDDNEQIDEEVTVVHEGA